MLSTLIDVAEMFPGYANAHFVSRCSLERHELKQPLQPHVKPISSAGAWVSMGTGPCTLAGLHEQQAEPAPKSTGTSAPPALLFQGLSPETPLTASTINTVSDQQQKSVQSTIHTEQD